MCLLVCLLVCLLRSRKYPIYRPHDICPHCGAASEWPRAAKPPRASPRARGQAHAQRREHARACRTTSQGKNRCADAFQKQNRTRAHVVVYVTAEIFKKREKENQHATSQVQFKFAFSWSVYFSNRTESYLIFGRSRPWSARYTI